MAAVSGTFRNIASDKHFVVMAQVDAPSVVDIEAGKDFVERAKKKNDETFALDEKRKPVDCCLQAVISDLAPSLSSQP